MIILFKKKSNRQDNDNYMRTQEKCILGIVVSIVCFVLTVLASEIHSTYDPTIKHPPVSLHLVSLDC